MPNTFWIIMGIAVFAIYILPKLFKDHKHFEKYPDHEANKQAKDKAVEAIRVAFHGGPLNGHKEEVPRNSEFYVVPYLPRDEMGQVDTNEAKIAGQIGDRVFFQPNFAYYQQSPIAEDYIYVRDISEDEMAKLHGNPDWRPLADDHDDE